MPWPAVVVILEEPAIGVTRPYALLYRFDANGRYAGDTWHEQIDDAIHQAEWEYGAALGDWHAIPANIGPDLPDLAAYALASRRPTLEELLNQITDDNCTTGSTTAPPSAKRFGRSSGWAR